MSWWQKDIVVMNSTLHDWKVIDEHLPNIKVAYPEQEKLIKPRSIFILNLIYNSENTITNDYFEIKYQIMDSQNSTFTIRGKIDGAKDPDLEIYLENLETENQAKGSVVILPRRSKNTYLLFFIGESGHYIGPSIKTESWMQDHRNILGDHALDAVCIPGTHDAGMSSVTWKTLLASACNTLTQTHNVLGQLKLGIRYFDIRPVIQNAKFYTGHYSKIINIWEGANGESLDSIIDGINEFTKNHNEVIILRLDHSLTLDVGFFQSYRKFNQEEWFKLFKKLSTVNHLYHHDGSNNITKLTVNKLTNNGTRPAVLFLAENKKTYIDLGEYKNKGFFYISDINMYDKYSHTSDLYKMTEDQIDKMNKHSPSQYFLLSWTLTQEGVQVSTCNVVDSYSIKKLADYANENLIQTIYPRMTKTIYPNIIHIDNVKDDLVATLALAINWTVFSYKPK
ncbi:phosphatidylinositol-specific phospholipase C [Xenorhabdus mauleonii]|uniref:Phosphatidylinositol-specific phospholipase C n=1 Tax=Xenorhabdus mauleonii TaxID=351675 RepID=A0A1I3PL25_9GAMM|nr:hypothetical protein [Xenorhabdus mauleonii]PHM44763.1 phosphatidylinositol-specific phospholipase C [Xenorhabdus mauleonii]SFJ22248.1 Variant-surface-glycoprotein phospholipase C [Xenorhabdus mauleonii]